MTKKVVLQSTAVHRKTSLKEEEVDPPKRRLAEVVGSSAAECTAVCCCCPLTVLNLVIFAAYKMPTGLCRKALNRRKRHRILKKKGLVQQRSPWPDFPAGTVGPAREEGFDEANNKIVNDVAVNRDDMSLTTTAGILELEEEMWGRFSQTGFWRSSSQRHT